MSETYQGRHRSGVVGDAFAASADAYIRLRLENGPTASIEHEPPHERKTKRIGLGGQRFIVREQVKEELDKSPKLKDPPHGVVFGKNRLLAMAMDETPQGRRRRVQAPETPESLAPSDEICAVRAV